MSIRGNNSQKCFTENVSQETWLHEIHRLCQDLKAAGIDQVFMGMELEFSVLNYGKVQYCERKKQEFIRDLAAQCAFLGDGTDLKNVLQDKANQLRNFNAAEIMMYDLTEKNPNTKDIVEYRFGKGDGGRGYYDDFPVLEMRLKYVDPVQLCRNRSIFLKELKSKMEEYGLVNYQKVRHHISTSFWKNNHNLMSSASSQHSVEGARIAEGIARAAYDASIIFKNPSYLPVAEISLSLVRNRQFRLAAERLETRLSRLDKDADYQHPEAIIALILAGGLAGAQVSPNARSIEGVLRAVPVKRAIFSSNIQNDWDMLLRYLNTLKSNNIVSDNHPNHFSADSQCLQNYLPYIAARLGLVEEGSDEFCRLKNTAQNSGALKNDRYKEYYEKINAMFTHVLIKDRTVTFPSSFDNLSEIYSLVGVHNTFEIGPYYNSLRSDPTVGSMVARFLDSETLRQNLSPELYKKLCVSAVEAFGEPSPQDRVDCFETNQFINRIISRRNGAYKQTQRL